LHSLPEHLALCGQRKALPLSTLVEVLLSLSTLGSVSLYPLSKHLTLCSEISLLSRKFLSESLPLRGHLLLKALRLLAERCSSIPILKVGGLHPLPELLAPKRVLKLS